MGNKSNIKHKFWNWECPYCHKRFEMTKLDNEGYVDHIETRGTSRKVVWCPACDGQELVERD